MREWDAYTYSTPRTQTVNWNLRTRRGTAHQFLGTGQGCGRTNPARRQQTNPRAEQHEHPHPDPRQASKPPKQTRTNARDPGPPPRGPHEARQATANRPAEPESKQKSQQGGTTANSGQATQERCLCSLLSGGVCAPQALGVRAPGTCCLQRVCNIRPWVRSQALRPMRSMTGPHDVLPSRCY